MTIFHNNHLIALLRHSADVGLIRTAAQSENTRIIYQWGWKCFTAWCKKKGMNPQEVDADDIIRFFVAMGYEGPTGNKPLSLNTLRIFRSALNDKWTQMGIHSPASEKIIDDLFKGLARILGRSQIRVKAIREYQLLAMLQLCKKTLHGFRDATILSLGFSAALRRSEVCNLQAGNLIGQCSEGITLIIHRSKTDQEGMSQSIAVIEGRVIRPLKHLRKWLKESQIQEGYLFQTLKNGVPTGKAIAPGEIGILVKRYVGLIGLDPKEYSGHSLRAGFVTSAAAHHARIDKIMEVTRHKNAQSVYRYIRDVDSFRDPAGASFL